MSRKFALKEYFAIHKTTFVKCINKKAKYIYLIIVTINYLSPNLSNPRKSNLLFIRTAKKFLKKMSTNKKLKVIKKYIFPFSHKK